MLVATDIAARGIHVDDIELVVHVDPPAEHKAYLHRSGRTARAGSGGDVVTIVLPEQRGDVRQLTRAAKITATPKPVFPGDATLTRLVGEVAAPVKYVAPAGSAHQRWRRWRRRTWPRPWPRWRPRSGGAPAAGSGQRRRRGGSGRGTGGGSGASTSGGPRVVYSRG